jgi:hypothetical protein
MRTCPAERKAIARHRCVVWVADPVRPTGEAGRVGCRWRRGFVGSRVMADARGFLESLAGRRLHTATGRENRVLGCDGETARVWTARSPSGQAVPIMWVQEALDRLERDGEIEISVQSVGCRSAFIGAVLAELPGTQVVRTISPPRSGWRRRHGRDCRDRGRECCWLVV